MRRFIGHRPSYALIASTLAVVMALGGTAFAALVVTGKQIKDSSLTTLDVRNGSLESSDVNSDARTALRVKGPVGAPGLKGLTGGVGNTGVVGDTGTPAKNAYAWAYNEQNSVLPAMTTNNGETPSPLPANDPKDWWNASGSGNGEWTNPDAGYGGVNLQLADGQNDGLLILAARSDVVATAMLTAWHEDADVHSRLECRLRITDIATNSQAVIGQPVIVSTGQLRHIVDIPLAGGIRREPGTYSVRPECRDLDLGLTGYDKWFVIKGNLSVLSARDWR